MAAIHSDEFKRDAVRIALTSGLTRRQVASDLGIGLSTLGKWVRAVSEEAKVPAQDAEVLHSATMQGLVCLGKTHMTELAFSGLGLNPVTATPPCINFPDAVPGGSSSGAAASVAFGLAPAAIGSDTGGSVRVPAAWNDLVGLKTTTGRLPLKGVVPLCEKFDTAATLLRTICSIPKAPPR